MSTIPAIIRVRFRSSGFSAEEIQQATTELSRVGTVQMRKHHMMEAGGSFDFDIVVGLAAGIASSALYDLLKVFANGLGKIWRAKEAKSGFGIETYSIHFQCNDVDVVLVAGNGEDLFGSHSLRWETIECLPEIVQEIADHLSRDELRKLLPIEVDVLEPLVHLARDGRRVFIHKRHWIIKTSDWWRILEYDSESGRLEECERPEWLGGI